MARLNLVLFGGFDASIGARRIALPLRKAQALLAFLAVPPGKPHSRERLASLFWGDSAEDQARNSLRQTLFAIRSGLGAPRWLTTDGPTVWLEPHDVDVDVLRFERLLAEGTHEALGEAVTLYRGDVLEGFDVATSSFDAWLETTRERFRRAATAAMTRLLDRQVETGAIEAAIETAGRLLHVDPLQEAIHRTLIGLYARQGRRTDAIRQYQACVDLLRRELHTTPEPATEEAYRTLLGARPLHSVSPGAPRTGRDTGAHHLSAALPS